MKPQLILHFFCITGLLFLTTVVTAHPTGNMIVVGEHVLWSYINPVSDPNHHACVMIWTSGSAPKVFIQSEFSASDYMLYAYQDQIYLLERKYISNTDQFEARLLKTTIEGDAEVIWDWFTDENRVGEGGFMMRSDDQMVFAQYPGIYQLTKGEKPQEYIRLEEPIIKLRPVQDGQILLLGEDVCYLTTDDGAILKRWDQLLESQVSNPPLNRNQIFDADYANGKLLLAYWGKRSFDVIDANGQRTTVLQQQDPLTPHWVVFWGERQLLFASKMIFDGSPPSPYLILLTRDHEQTVLWSTD